MKLQFSTKEIFSVVDGRLSTKIGIVYEILNAFTGTELYTHELPLASDYLKKTNPDWFAKATKELDEIKEKVGDNFEKLMDYIDKFYFANYHEVTEMTNEQKKGFLNLK